MRKTILMGLGLAAALAGAAAAQQPGTEPRSERKEQRGGPGGRFEGRGGPRGQLLKDITLSDAQKTQIQQLRKSQRDKMDTNRDQMKKQFDEARAARQRGDTVAAKAIMERNRVAMEQARSQEIAAIRNILTAEQRVQFDKNVVELKAREAERGKRVGETGQRGKGEGRGKAKRHG